jgi:hypothetical protein
LLGRAGKTATAIGASLVAATAALVLAAGAPARSAAACGLPDTAPVWIDYGEATVTPDVRAVLAKPGVVVSTSGAAVPAAFRASGAATTYFERNLPRLVGGPSAPADPASIAAAAARELTQAKASTGCDTPWIALNELLGADAAAPWSPSTAAYRANLLALVQQLAAGGSRPFLLVHGNPNLAGAAADWWRQVAQSADLVYEAYYDANNITSLGPLLGNRRMRLGMRGVIAQYRAIGIPVARLGIMLGFHSGVIPGAGGRQGLQPREAWLRVVKWEALAARQVAADTGLPSIWSWGWGTFGPGSADADKAAAACVYLWARDSSLCDGPAAGGPAFATSLTEGQIALPAGVACTLPGRRILSPAVTRLAALTRDRHAALTALVARASLGSAVPVPTAQVLAVERRAVARSFHGKRAAYVRALARRHVTVELARDIIRDELRRRALAARLAAGGSPETTLQWTDDVETKAAANLTCRADDLPGSGNFPASNDLDLGVVPLPGLLPFLFADRTPPAAPVDVQAASATGSVSLAWAYGREPDLAGYRVYRSASAAGPFVRIGPALLARPSFVDASAPSGMPSFYVVRAVDSSGNVSASSQPLSVALP